MHFPYKFLENRFYISCHFSCVKYNDLKFRLLTDIELLFSFLEFIVTLLFDLKGMGSRDMLVHMAYFGASFPYSC